MKSKENLLYKESQNFTLVNITSFILTITFTVLYFKTGGIEEIPLSLFILIILFLLSPLILFYKMETKLTEKQMTIIFGIGVVKKTFENNSLNFSQAQGSRIPWYYGVGIRIAKDGMVYNARPGSVIKIQKRGSKKHIYIGTQKQKEFLKVCRQINY